jgi:hypothetical protein
VRIISISAKKTDQGNNDMKTNYSATFTDRTITRTSNREYAFAYLVQFGTYICTGFAATRDLADKAARAHGSASVYPKKMVNGFVVSKTRAEMQAERDAYHAKFTMDRLEIVAVDTI